MNISESLSSMFLLLIESLYKPDVVITESVENLLILMRLAHVYDAESTLKTCQKYVRFMFYILLLIFDFFLFSFLHFILWCSSWSSPSLLFSPILSSSSSSLLCSSSFLSRSLFSSLLNFSTLFSFSSAFGQRSAHALFKYQTESLFAHWDVGCSYYSNISKTVSVVQTWTHCRWTKFFRNHLTSYWHVNLSIDFLFADFCVQLNWQLRFVTSLWICKNMKGMPWNVADTGFWQHTAVSCCRILNI